jgi:NADPH:quinone reductase-like Zn-dependent oxidoreductase
VVVEAGPGVTGWQKGDEVMTHPVPLADQGTWAPLLIVPAALLAAKPADLEWALAGAFPVPALTASQALDALNVREGERLLVNGAGSVTGGLIVGLAAMSGVAVVATAGPSSADRIRRAGASLVLDYHNPDWPHQVRVWTDGHGVDAAANTARGAAGSAIVAVRDGGRLATITSDPPRQDRGITVSSVYVRADSAQLASAARALSGGHLPFVVGSEFALEDAAAALARAVRGAGGAVALLL